MKRLNRKARVCIVEDDKLLALVEKRLVEKLGYEVVGQAATGEDAIRMVQDLEPDIIIMDISLKGSMDGIETVERIRQEHYPLPVIFLSGNSDRMHLERAKKAGFTDYLVKPVTLQELSAPLLKAARLHRPAVAG